MVYNINWWKKVFLCMMQKPLYHMNGHIEAERLRDKISRARIFSGSEGYHRMGAI